MKVNLILKTAVVAMAAFGAYAFSSTSKDSHHYRTFDADINECTNTVSAECVLTGNETCSVNFNGKIMELYDLSCSNAIKHNSVLPVIWN